MKKFRQALELHQGGHLAEAKRLYRVILEHEPGNVDVMHLLGLAEFQEKNHAEAERLVSAAIHIRGDIPDYHFNYGLILSDLNRFVEAERAFRHALQLRPGNVGALSSLCSLLYSLGRYAEAEEACLQAHSLAPRDSMICLSLANALLAQGQVEKSITLFNKALALNPELAEAHGNLGVAFRKLGRSGDAEAHLRRALQLKPQYAEALNNLGAILLDERQLAEAESCLRSALEARPDYASAYNNLGNVLMARRCVAEAETAYARALEISPEYAEAHWNVALAHLLQGDFRNGWREYEWRLKRLDTRHLYPGFSQPSWKGEDLEGKHILLYAEQGMGDTLQFVRFAPMVAARGGRVLVRCQPPLQRLLRSMPGVEAVFAEGDPLPHFDVQCPLLSLPYLFGVDAAEKIPADVPYLGVEPALLEVWSNKLAAGHHLKVGLVWAGAPRKDDPDACLIDLRRSMSLSLLKPLLEVQGVDFYSLQKGEAGLEATGCQGKLLDLMGEVKDFSDTAALISHLDVVISVDTAVAHLAGALAKPVWLLSRFDGCWRWMQERDDSPWYPTLRLFRQPQPVNWEPVVERVVEALKSLAASHLQQNLEAGSLMSKMQDGVRQGMTCLEAGRVTEARSILHQVLENAPDYALALHARGLVELKAGNAQEAVQWLEQAAAKEPGSEEILTALGDALRQIGRLDEAMHCLKEAIRLAPSHAEAHNNMGAVYLARKQVRQAVIAFSNALHYKPQMVMAHFNLGVAHRELNQTDEAAAAFQRAIDLKPDFAEAHVSLGMAWLLMGRMREGFGEYEWRLRLKPARYQGPQWDGQIDPGTTLLVYFEQGYGDAIQFVRYLPFIAQHGMHLVVQCDSTLHGLMRSVSGVTDVIGFEDAPPAYDAQCALLSLPHLFHTTLDKIPDQVPYLAASREKSVAWQERLAGLGETVKIGLCWQGNARHGADRERSIELGVFDGLAGMPGVTWISLHNHPPREDEASSATRLGLVDVSAQLLDFSDTAALITQLDLVISVDTAVAHLAGALNRPVWTLLRYAPDWRWLLEREESPWYPGMRLFRQREPGNWLGVISAVDATLRGVMISLLDQPAE